MSLKRLTERRVVVAAIFLLTVLLGGIAMSKLGAQTSDQPSPQAGDEVKALLALVRNEQLRENEPKRVVQAIKRLGELRSTEAISDLTKLLAFRQTLEWEDSLGPNGESTVEIHPIAPSERYPAARALIDIGRPGLPALVEVIETQQTGSITSENALYTVMQIFREKPTEAVAYLTQAAAKASSSQSGQRLSYAADKAAEIVKKLPPQ